MAGDNALELDLSSGFKHVNTVDEIVSSIRKTLDTITQEVDSAKATWQGQANKTFTEVSLQWGDEATRLNRALDEVKTTLSNSAFKGGQQTDETIQSSFSSINVGGLNL